MRRLVSCLVVLAGGVLAAQTQAPIFRTGVDVVRLDVSVLDKTRRPVRGLTAADFVVSEDGKPQRVVGVSEIVAEENPDPPPVWSRSAQPDVESNNYDDRRLFVLLIDDSLCCQEVPLLQPTPGRDPRDPRIPNAVRFDPWSANAIKAIGRGVISRLVAGDVAAVIYTRNTIASQRFTSNTQQLLDAVDAFKPSTASESCMAYHESLGRLWDVTEYLMAVPQRRKAVIYVTPGVPANFLTTERNRKCPFFDFANDAKEILWRAQQANVNIYTVDPNGLRPGAHFGTRKGLELEFLQTLAENSGGRAFINTNDFEPGIAQIFNENASYYLLGYQTTNAVADGKFRRLTVKLARSGDYEVRVRSGFYRPRAASANGETTPGVPSVASTLPQSLDRLLPQLDIALQVNAVAFAVPGRADAALAVTVGVRERIPANMPSFTQHLNLRLVAYTADGDPKYSDDRTATVTLTPQADDTAHAELVSRIDMPPGRYRLRVVVHDGDRNATGSIEQDVAIPEFQRNVVSMSGIVLTRGAGPEAVAADRLAGLLPLTPTSRREFLTSDVVTALARVYQGSQAPVTPAVVTIRILDRQGTEKHRSVESLDASRFQMDRSAELRFDLPLSTLTAGPHLLTFEAAVGTRRALAREVIFEIR